MTDRQKAMTMALELERAAKLAKSGELIEAQAREIVRGIMERANIGETLRAVTIKDHFAAWLKTKDANNSESTAARYRTVAALFLQSLGKKAERPLAALTAQDVRSFHAGRIKAGMAPRTAALDVKIIRSALNEARRDGLIPTNVAEAVKLPRHVEGVERGTFTAAEVTMLLNAAEGEWRTLILFAYFTGARLSDCCAMEWRNVDLIAGKLSFRQGKTGARLEVPLHPDLLAHLLSLASSDEPHAAIMPGMASLKPGGRHGLSETFKRIMRKAGLDAQKVASAGVRQLSRRSFHALRHSFASALANQGVSPERRMKLTGHKSERTHAGYSHHEMEVLRADLSKMPGLPKAIG